MSPSHLAAALLLSALAGCAGPVSSNASPEAAIRAALEVQAAAWNGGDLEGFLAWYERSPAVSFSGASGTMRGWEAVARRYKARYPDREAMGRLAFSQVDVRLLGQDHALVLGQYLVERVGGRLEGLFSLVMARTDDGWRILHDHTTAFAPPPG